MEAVAGFCRELRTLAGQLPPAPDAGGGSGEGGSGGEISTGRRRQRLLRCRGATSSQPTTAVRACPAVVLRSGVYVTHDHGLYARMTPGEQPGGIGPELRPALELWARVLSAPEPGLASPTPAAAMSSFDQGTPIPLRIRRPDGQTCEPPGCG